MIHTIRKLFVALVASLLPALAFGTTLFSDNFNRADSGTVDATNWTENGGGQWAITTNQAADTGAGAFFLITTTSAHAAVADCKATITRTTAAATWDGGAIVRAASDGSSGYFVDVDVTGGTMSVWRRVASADTQLGANVTGLTLANNDTYSIQVSGTGATVSILIFQNSTQRGGTFTDSSGSRITTAGQAGIAHFQPSAGTYDNFLLEDVAIGGGTNLLMKRRRH